ncbi:MAG: hypothetical protein M3N07_10375 [Pseudomonadota bacterium]|nr:hypothetical protein [Pseudomonadota bacterium]
MISALMIVPLLLAQQVLASAERSQFSRCMRAFIDSKLEERMSPEAFDTAQASACSQQEAAYRSAYIAAAMRAGDNRAAAEEGAGIEIEDLRDNYKELFRNAQPE